MSLATDCPSSLASASDRPLLSQVQLARAAAQHTATLPTAIKNAALEAMATALLEHQESILAANQADLERAAEMVESRGVVGICLCSPEAGRPQTGRYGGRSAAGDPAGGSGGPSFADPGTGRGANFGTAHLPFGGSWG
jgi:hypothetical protein